MTSGGTLILPKGETIAISKGLTVDVSARDITLDLNGSTLQQVGAVSVVVGKGLQTKAENVALGTNAEGNTTVSYAKLPADIAVGDWVKVVSDNALPGDMIEWGHEDARHISLDHINLKETVNYSTIALNRPVDNQIANSFFESYASGNLATAENVTVTNTTYSKAGSNLNDVVIGSVRDDLLLGGKGNDTLDGAAGDDYIWGGQGADTLTGGAGRDRFAYHSVAEGGDLISHFQAGANGDVIDLSVIAAKLNGPMAMWSPTAMPAFCKTATMCWLKSIRTASAAAAS